MSILIDSTILMEQLESSNNTSGFSQQQIYLKNTQRLSESTLTLEDISKIFIRGCERIQGNLESIREIDSEVMKLAKSKKPENQDKISILKRDRAVKYDNSNLLLRQFINHFSVCNDPNALDFAKLMFDRFNFIQEQLDHYCNTANQNHLNKAQEFIGRAITTLARFKDAIKHDAN